ncbi:DNA cytosine methyltransferase [Streptomyces sp. NBC_00207]|uniref:DNA cytosine methyltransferase n=1 Tax=Streptomyces sp. NBC_00207 TaxID=2903635 RepID=UPI00386A92A4
MTGPLRLGSLCSGLGGLDIAAEEFFGARLAWYADNDPAARQVLAHHWPDATGHGDITTVDFTTMPAVDILTAGIPCQPHSVAGPRRGEEDHRDLWPATRDALRALGHPFLVMENVPGWARDLPRVVGDLAHLGYRVVWGRMGSYRIGTPHQRTRLWLCAQHEQPPAHPPRASENEARSRKRTPSAAMGGSGQTGGRHGKHLAAELLGMLEPPISPEPPTTPTPSPPPPARPGPTGSTRASTRRPSRTGRAAPGGRCPGQLTLWTDDPAPPPSNG